MEIEIKNGKLVDEPCNALVVVRRSNPFALRGADFPVLQAAGRIFHNQFAVASLREGETLVAHAHGFPHRGKFVSIIFVVDDLGLTMEAVAVAALSAADAAGFRKVVLPIGADLRADERRSKRTGPAEDCADLVRGVENFRLACPHSSIEELVLMGEGCDAELALIKEAFS